MNTAAIFSLELSVPSVRRGFLFGAGKIPVTVIRLGVLTIVTMGVEHMKAYRNIVEQGVEFEEWMVERAPSVRLHKKKAEAKARAQAQADFKARADYWREAFERADKERSEARQENSKLKSALALLAKLREEV